jgi:hypothetical protein
MGARTAVYRVSHDRLDNKTALSEAKADGMSIFQRAIQQYVIGYKPSAGAVVVTASFATEVRGAALRNRSGKTKKRLEVKGWKLCLPAFSSLSPPH